MRTGTLLMSELALKSCKLHAVAHDLIDQRTLIRDRRVLLHDQKGQQSIGDQEQNDQKRQHAVLLRCGLYRCTSQRNRYQVAIPLYPKSAGALIKAAREPQVTTELSY